jgi:HEAT repeat protein
MLRLTQLQMTILTLLILLPKVSALNNTDAPATAIANQDNKETPQTKAPSRTTTPQPASEKTSKLLRDLTDDNEDVRKNAADALAQLRQTAIPSLKKLLDSSKATARRGACQVLGTIGPEAKDVVSCLHRLVTSDPDFQVRCEAATALGKIGARTSIPVLIGVYLSVPKTKDDGEVRHAAWEALTNFGPNRSGAVEALLELLKSEDDLDLMHTAYALKEFGPKAVPPLIDIIRDDKMKLEIHGKALYALQVLGADAKPAVPVLTKLLSDKNEAIRENACGALGTIGAGAKAALPELKKALTDPSPLVRFVAATSITLIDPSQTDAVRVLAGFLKDPDAGIRQIAASNLLQLREKAQPAVSELILALRDREPLVRLTTAYALQAIGREARAAESALIAACKDSDPKVRKAAREALRAIRADKP